ncbi:hypothetical protein [uncultured Lamprocystis sp.]|jgi:DNA-binding CsgD family transcriptional regulator|uniref:helix-turn-helix transcriptional regulator n=1 Tax=uncultured Lamprocystis sp. TaxID=543132 RepID=UPI0025EDBBBB|nr:hypothetical protein [uncultured Lamprocystis sp.]
MTTSEPVLVDLDLLEQIHDVALGRASWKDVLTCLTSEFSAEVGLLAVYEVSPDQARGLATTDPDGSRWQQYAEHFATIDPFAARIRSGQVPPGLIMTGEDLVPARVFCASEYFNDWFRPNGLRHTARAHIRIRDQLNLQLGMPRAAAAGPYSAAEVARLQRYFNHISRALRMADALATRTLQPDFDQVARTYGLTPAETKLIETLTECGSLRRSAERTHRSYYTLRAQLRTVFLKMGTRSQTELMRMIHKVTSDSPEADGRRSNDT